MISNSDFNLACFVLDKLTENLDDSTPIIDQFSEEFAGQPVSITALKILHRAVHEGLDEQKEKLTKARHKIVQLNELLKTSQFTERAEKKLGERIDSLDGFEIELPPSSFEKMMETVSLIPRIVFSIFIDLLLLPVAGVLLLVSLAKTSFDSDEIKQDKIPILLVHGCGFNQSEWILGREFLKKDGYGSVFSLNYDGLVSNDPDMGVNDYAAGKVREKILEIQRLTGQNKIILIGHSMGGLISGYYAEHLSAQDGIDVEHVMSVGSPWKGSPLLGYFGDDSVMTQALHKKHMTPDHPFQKQLVAKALQSERSLRRKYYSIGGTTDLLVPGLSSRLTEDPRRQRSYSYLGHYGLVAAPTVWLQVRSWLDEIYSV